MLSGRLVKKYQCFCSSVLCCLIYSCIYKTQTEPSKSLCVTPADLVWLWLLGSKILLESIWNKKSNNSQK